MAMVTAMAARGRKKVIGTQMPALLGALGALCCSAPPAQGGTWEITPSIAVSETATDNVALSATQKQSDLITDLAPGLRIVGRGDRVKLNFDYQLHNFVYAQDSSRNNTQNALNAFGSLEAIDNWLFIDASGVITQQSISAFNGSSPANSSINSNSTEASNFRISPYIRGSFGDFANYQLRYAKSSSNAKSNAVANAENDEWSANLRGTTGLAALSWSLDGSSQSVAYGNGRTTEADRLRGVLTYQFDPQFRMSLIGGRESNDYLSLEKESKTTHGWGLEWMPSERTQVSYTKEKRFFGDAQSLSLSHRTARTIWRYSDSKDVSVLPNQLATVGMGSMYDLFYGIFAPQLAPQFPNDPIGLSNAIMQLMRANGIPLNQQVVGGFLTTRVSIQRRKELSLALVGVRNTVTFAATQSDSEGLGTGLSGVSDDFSLTPNIRQRGVSANWSHQLSGLSTLTATFSRQISTGVGAFSLNTTQNLVLVNFSTQLAPKTRALLGVRHTTVDGTTNYRENAVIVTLSHQF